MQENNNDDYSNIEELFKEGKLQYWEIVGGGEINSEKEKEILAKLNHISEQAVDEFLKIPKIEEEEVKFSRRIKILTGGILIVIIAILIMFFFTGNRLKLMLYNDTKSKIQNEIKTSSNDILKQYYINKKDAYKMIMSERDNMKKYSKIMNDYANLSSMFKRNQEFKNEAIFMLNEINEYDKLFLSNIERAIKDNDINGLILASTYKNIKKEQNENNLFSEKITNSETSLNVETEKTTESALKQEYNNKIETMQVKELYGIDVNEEADTADTKKTKNSKQKITISESYESVNENRNNVSLKSETQEKSNIKVVNGIEEEGF